jgi:TPR repeat protein
LARQRLRLAWAAVSGGALLSLALPACSLAGPPGHPPSPRIAADHAEAASALRALAEAHDAEAEFRLAVIYEKGLDGRPDPTRALEWYRKAADDGSPGAQRVLAQDYDFGLGGLPQDTALAITWYRKAAAGGDPYAERVIASSSYR